MEQWADNVKKYGAATGLVLAIPFLLPYAEKYLDSKTAYQTEAFVYKIKGELLADMQRMMDKQTTIAVDAHAKTKLSDKQAVYLMRTAVGYQSIHKINWLRRYMERIPSSNIAKMEYSITSAIRAEFIRQSNVYIEALNGFVHPKLGRLGEFVADEFPMDDFLQRVTLVVLNNDCGSCDSVMDAVMYIMLDEQNKLWQIAEERMNK